MHEHKIDIPERFYSDLEGKPFETCHVCGKYLLNDGTSYVVEKALKSYKEDNFYATIFEYAICMPCHMEMQKSMSKESINKLQMYYMDIMALKKNKPILIDLQNFNLDNWLSKCFFTGDEVKEMNEYQLVAQFNGNKMVMNTPPMLVGEAAMEDMSELMSNQTIDEMNGFKKRLITPDPDIDELIFGKKLIML